MDEPITPLQALRMFCAAYPTPKERALRWVANRSPWHRLGVRADALEIRLRHRRAARYLARWERRQ